MSNVDQISEENFSFNTENTSKIEQIIGKYPKGKQKSAVMPLLDLAQRQNGKNYISTAAIEEIAKILSITPREVYEVATFYSMYNKAPVGKYLLQVCGTTPCMLRGSESLLEVACGELSIKIGETTEDGLFTLVEVECLGACSNAPIVQINDWYYEDLSKDDFVKIIRDLKQGKKVDKYSALGRKSAEPK
jgi:NADH-quinone oxidoreductase E subunit